MYHNQIKLAEIKKINDQSKHRSSERDAALFHYRHSNVGFDENQKRYKNQLNNKLEKQNDINFYANSPGRFQTYSVDRQTKEKFYNDLHDYEVIKKSVKDDIVSQ